MADSFTPNLNLRKPEVGAAFDTWGGTAGLNNDMDLIDAVFLPTGLGTAVGLHVGPTQVLNCEGTPLFADSTDTTKAAVLDSSLLTTGTLRTFQFPDQSGVLALKAPTGTVLSGYYLTAPGGYVLLCGRTIGAAGSGATERANADTADLFTLFWNLGVVPSGGRGASAAADFAALKALALPDHRGRTLVGMDNIGGTSAGVAPGWNALGLLGGEWTHVLAGGELPTHNHLITDPGHSHAITDPGHTHGAQSQVYASQNFNPGGGTGLLTNGGNIVANTTGITINGVVTGITATNNAGSSAAHNNVQPSISVNAVIAL